jgi:hypothetical protein
MWKPLVFPYKYFCKRSSEQLSRQAAWDIVMYTPAAKERKEKRCFLFKCSKFSYYVEVGGMFSLEILLRHSK